jgi:hypothetical protein
MATIDQIYSEITKEGVERKLAVVPEFTIKVKDKCFGKKVDVSWLRRLPQTVPGEVGALREWEIAACFEIEGCDVSVKRIEQHAEQFHKVRCYVGGSLPCYVVLYDRALNRAKENWHIAHPWRYIATRENVAQECGNVVKVRGGDDFTWLREIQI